LASFPGLETFERKLAQIFVRDRVFEKKLAIAFSGGRDSCALLAAMVRLAHQFRCNVEALHVVHRTEGRISRARKKASRQAEELCQKLSVPFICVIADATSDSEEHLRKARYAALTSLKEKVGYDLLLTAHHSDDLLETRLLRLLRGTGPLGLQAIRARRGDLWRPLLECDSKDILQYAESRKLTWFEDPTNQDLRWMRNWVRQVWLKQLDQDHPQARAVLARSLQTLANRLDSETIAYIRRIKKASPSVIESSDDAASDPALIPWGLSLEALSLPHSKILDQLALFCHTVGLSSYTQSHLEEILKRLRSHDGFQACRILGATWTVEGGLLRVSRSVSRS